MPDDDESKLDELLRATTGGFSSVNARLDAVKEHAAEHRKETKDSMTEIHERINETAEDVTTTKTRLEEHMKDDNRHPENMRSSMHLQAQPNGSLWTPQKGIAGVIGGTLIVATAGWKLVEVIKAFLTQ